MTDTPQEIRRKLDYYVEAFRRTPFPVGETGTRFEVGDVGRYVLANGGAILALIDMALGKEN